MEQDTEQKDVLVDESPTVKATTAPKTRRKPVRKKAPAKVDKTIDLGVFKLHKDSPDISWGTDESACFDIRAYLPAGEMVVVYNGANKQRVIRSKTMISQNKDGITLDPQDRALIPSGLIFDLPPNYTLRGHPRSGMSWKRGLSLSNCEAVIDYDYIDQLYISIVNLSGSKVVIRNGEKIAQCELVEYISKSKIRVNHIAKKPKQKTNRVGGLGHTGDY